MSLSDILSRQRAWARRLAPGLRGHVLDSVEQNLLFPLKPESMQEFGAGAGDELGMALGTKRRAKMRSLRSSSALAANVFDYWRGRDLVPVARALRLDGRFTGLRFEQPFDHGVGGIVPNLDVVLYDADGSVVGIECKFCEPYDHDEPFPPLKAKYFAERSNGPNPGRWSAVGLPTAQSVAAQLGHTVKYQHLDAGQLLKHLLGLARHEPVKRPVRLVYLWFDAGGSIADAHRREVNDLESRLAPDSSEVRFIPLTYQELFASLEAQGLPDTDYLSRLRERYFASTGAKEGRDDA